MPDERLNKRLPDPDCIKGHQPQASRVGEPIPPKGSAGVTRDTSISTPRPTSQPTPTPKDAKS